MVHTVTGDKSPTAKTRIRAYRGITYVRHRPGFGNPAPVVRKECFGLSAGARRRLLRFMAECNEPPSLFVTVTYPGQFPDPATAKEDLRVWLQRLLRIAERAGIRLGVLWRMERQARGAPHFHLLVWCSGEPRSCLRFLLPSSLRARASSAFGHLHEKHSISGGMEPLHWSDWVATLSASWFERTARFADDADTYLKQCVDVRIVKDPQHAATYIAKYSAKVDNIGWPDPETGERLHTGRVWGYRGDKRVLDRRALMEVTLPSPAHDNGHLQEVWTDLRIAWGETCEAEGWHCYAVHLCGDAFWGLVDSLILHCGMLDPPKENTVSRHYSDLYIHRKNIQSSQTGPPPALQREH